MEQSFGLTMKVVLKRLGGIVNSICRTVNLTKKYKDFTALDNVSLNIRKGEIYGLIGENGAGKTTLIKSIAGLIRSTSGAIELFESSIPDEMCQLQRRIGYTIENPALYVDMTAKENLEVFCLQKGISKYKIQEILKLVGLADTQKKKVKMFSLGMKQRLALATALLGKPDFLVLDEPLNGLDPTGIVELRSLLTDLNKEWGITILLSSHILSELHKLATYYGIVHKSRLLEEITADDLDKKCEKYISVTTSNAQKSIRILQDTYGSIGYATSDDNTIKIFQIPADCAHINKILVLGGVDVSEIRIKGDSLEGYFAAATGGRHNE